MAYLKVETHYHLVMPRKLKKILISTVSNITQIQTGYCTSRIYKMDVPLKAL